MSFLTKLERRFGRFALPNLTHVLIVGQVVVYALAYFRPPANPQPGLPGPNVEALEKIASADRDSARNMAIQTKDWTPRVLAYVIAAIWILINGALLVMAIKHNPVDTGMQAIVTGVMKTIDAALMLVLGYYFGSSASSGAKDQLLYNSTPSSTGGQ